MPADWRQLVLDRGVPVLPGRLPPHRAAPPPQAARMNGAPPPAPRSNREASENGDGNTPAAGDDGMFTGAQQEDEEELFDAIPCARNWTPADAVRVAEKAWPAWAGDRPLHLRDLPVTLWRRLNVPGAHRQCIQASRTLRKPYSVFGVDFTPDGRTMVAGRSDCTFQVLDGFTGEVVGENRRGHREGVNVVRFATPHHFFTASDDGFARLWDLRLWQRRPLLALGPHDSWVKSVEYVSRSGVLITTSIDGTLWAWRVPEIAVDQSTDAAARAAPALAADRDVDEDGREAEADGEGSPVEPLLPVAADTAADRFLWRIHIRGLTFARASPDGEQLVLSTSVGLLLLVHNLDAPALAADWADEPIAAWVADDTNSDVQYTLIEDDDNAAAPPGRSWRDVLERSATAAQRRNGVEVLDHAGKIAAHGNFSFTSPLFDPLGQRVYARLADREPWAGWMRHGMMHENVGILYDVRRDQDLPPVPLGRWLAPRFRARTTESVNMTQMFMISAFSACSRLVFAPGAGNVRLFHIDPAFVDDAVDRDAIVATYDGARSLVDRLYQPKIRPIDGPLAPLPVFRTVENVHAGPILGCTASPVILALATYGMGDDVRLNLVRFQ